MPPEMSEEKKISMRHTKLKAEEAALIAGELTKPSWESRNEGIHERISFADTLWGFDLAGGAYYKTPLRVTFVKPDSRAEKAGIKPGDSLLKINGVDTSTLTIQEAHDMIVKSGIHLKLSVTSPDDFEDSYYYYEDPAMADYDSEEERRLEEERARKRRVHAKVSSYWSLQWPWVSRRKLIYRESNCYMVPSKYENMHKEKYPERPAQRYFDDIILYDADETKKEAALKKSSRKQEKVPVMNGEVSKNTTNMDTDTENDSYMEDDTQDDSNNPTIEENSEIIEENDNHSVVDDTNEELTESENIELTKESDMNDIEENNSPQNVDEIENNIEENFETTAESTSNESENIKENNVTIEDDSVINEVLAKSNDNTPKIEEDSILDSILSDDGQNLENSESMNER